MNWDCILAFFFVKNLIDGIACAEFPSAFLAQCSVVLVILIIWIIERGDVVKKTHIKGVISGFHFFKYEKTPFDFGKHPALCCHFFKTLFECFVFSDGIE